MNLFKNLNVSRSIILLSSIIIISVFAACGGGGSGSSDGGDSGLTFAEATTPGQAVNVTANGTVFDMVYVNNQDSIVFPVSSSAVDPDDAGTSTMTRKFFIGKTEVTWALFAKVMIWALDQDKLVNSTSTTVHNRLNSTGAYYGNKLLVHIATTDKYMALYYDDTSQVLNYRTLMGEYPANEVTWYGMVMFCNWLTEMQDGNTDNIVYTGIPTDGTWDGANCTIDASKTGYRLPTRIEHEFASRWCGTDAGSRTDLVSAGTNGGDASLTAGYYWTPALYASGASANTDNEAATRAVAWYENDPDMGTDNALKPVAGKVPNGLGLYDMSGNIYERCEAHSSTNAPIRGGCWEFPAFHAQVAYWNSTDHTYFSDYHGFRIAKTQ